jgi:hypothetical protein
VILTLARGHYCHHTLQEFRASVGAQWTFLSDPERAVQKDLDIAEYTDPEHNPRHARLQTFPIGRLLVLFPRLTSCLEYRIQYAGFARVHCTPSCWFYRSAFAVPPVGKLAMPDEIFCGAGVRAI